MLFRSFELENYIANQYLRALIVIVIVFIILRVVIFILGNLFVKLTKRTKTDLDDKLLARTSKPLTFLILIIGLYTASLELVLTKGATLIVAKIFWSFVIFKIGRAHV